MPQSSPSGRGLLRGREPADLALLVNGQSVAVAVAPRRTLLDTLRESLGLTRTKKVCDGGTSAACTVLIDGRPVYSCVSLAVTCEGKAGETIEGHAKDGELHPDQRASTDADAYQCGFCTPGQVMSIVALIRDTPSPTEDDVRRAVSGNLCRCGAYPNIVRAGVNAGKRR